MARKVRKDVDVSGYDREREGRQETVRPHVRGQDVNAPGSGDPPSGAALRRPHAPVRPPGAYMYLNVRGEKRAEEIASGIRELHPFAYVEIVPGRDGNAEVWTDVDEWRRGPPRSIVDPSKLDPLEQRLYAEASGTPEERIRVLVNSAEGDTSQMSHYLRGLAGRLGIPSGHRLLVVALKPDGSHVVQSRDELAFDWRDESGPLPSANAAYDEAVAIAERKGWAVQVPGAFHESVARGRFGTGRP